MFLSILLREALLLIGLALIIAGLLLRHFYISAAGFAVCIIPLIYTIFPIHLASIIMIFLGLCLMALEFLKHGAFHGSAASAGLMYTIFGLLGLTNVYTYVPGTSESVSAVLLYVAVCLAIIVLLIIIRCIVQTLQSRPYSERALIDMRGKVGVAVDDIEPGKIGYVKIRGEYWRATSYETIRSGDEVVVIDVKDDGVLVVKRRQS